MRKPNGQFRSRVPTVEEAKAILLLVKAGFIKIELTMEGNDEKA